MMPVNTSAYINPPHPNVVPSAPLVVPPPVQTPPTPSVDPVTTGIDNKQFTDQLYGKPMPLSLGGRRRMGGYICWGPRRRYASNGQALWSFGVSFGLSADPDGQRDVLEIRFDSTIVYSKLINVFPPWLKFRFYSGTETQKPDPLAVQVQGTAATAFRGQILIFFEDVPSQTIPFVGALIADRVTGGLASVFFDTPTTTALRSVGAIDWAAGVMYVHGALTDYRLVSFRLFERTEISDVPIINRTSNFIHLNEIGFIWCPEAQVLFGVADDGFNQAVVAIDPDTAAILAEGPGGWNLFGGLTYYCDTSAGTVIVVASVDTLVTNAIHIDFYTPSSPDFTFAYVSSNNLGGHGSGGNINTIVRLPDGGTKAKFLVAQGPVLVLASVDVPHETVALTTVYTATTIINNLYGDPVDRSVILFLDDGTAVKLDSSYNIIWNITPGFTGPTGGSVGNVLSTTDGWRKTQQYFAFYADGGIYTIDLRLGTTNFTVDTTGTEPGGHMMYDSASNLLIITDNADPREFILGGASNDTIPIATALQTIAEFWGYTSEEFEVVNVPGSWIAVIIAYDTTLQDLLQLLKKVYPWDVIQTDKLRVIKRDLGTFLTPDGTIAAKDIKGVEGAEDQPAVMTTIAEEVELPAINELQFIDPLRDYNWNVARYRQPREPVAVTSSVSTEQIKIPIVMNMDDAKMLVASKSYRDREARATHQFTGMPSTYKYEPGDIVTLDTGIRTIASAKILSTDAGSDWSMQFNCESLLSTGPLFDPDFWITGVLPTDSGSTPTPTAVEIDHSEFVVYLDTPILSSQPGFQDTGGNGLRANFTIATRDPAGYSLRYAAMYFQSLFFWASYFYFPVAGTPLYGVLTTNLGDTPTPFMTDYANVLTFKLVCGPVSLLQPITYEQLMDNQQVFAVGRPGRWEIVGAGETVTDNGDGTFTLTGLMRGRRGSEVFCGSHAIGDQVVCLGAANSLAPPGYQQAIAGTISSAILPTPAGSISPYLGQSQTYAVAISTSYGLYGPAFYGIFGGGYGYTLGPSMSSPITGTAEKPYAPAHLDATISGSDIVIDWDRRDRLDFSHGGGADPPMSETSELYDIDIMDGSTVKRTYGNQPAPPFTYPDADIISDWGSMPGSISFDVYQRSAIVGRGFAGTATITL